jgi:hypothetical protein
VVRNLDLSAQGVSTGFDLADASLDADLSTYLAQNTP